jgi:hypothetical protein
MAVRGRAFGCVIAPQHTMYIKREAELAPRRADDVY